jgi:hypothetical protein
MGFQKLSGTVAHIWPKLIKIWNIDLGATGLAEELAWVQMTFGRETTEEDSCKTEPFCWRQAGISLTADVTAWAPTTGKVVEGQKRDDLS